MLSYTNWRPVAQARSMKNFYTVFIVAVVLSVTARAQINFSAGSYSQNFDVLVATNSFWTNNVTLPAWYASKAGGDNTNTLAGAGTSTSGGLYSFATNGVNANTDRALGSIATGALTPIYYGVRFTNNTGAIVSNILISYTGEQWRVGSSATVQKLAFSYMVTNAPITNSFSGSTWVNFTALDFASPNSSGSSLPLDGNNSGNRTVFTNVLLTGVTVASGQELFLRWQDVDDTGTDSGLAVDDLTVSFGTNSAPVGTPPVITAQPQSQTVTAGDNAVFSVTASGAPALTYQWKFYGTNLLNETNATLTLNSVNVGQSGDYLVVISNLVGFTNSQTATLTVISPPPPVITGSNTSITLMTYNVKGNGVTDWSTNAAQVQAIGRQLLYLKPDVITFNEIPRTNVWQMANWVVAFMPGYFIATNSGNDGFINCVIASRYPIIRSKSWLDGASLNPFGYTNTSSGAADNFTRDLFEAEINVPNWSLPLHVFTTHLKSSSGGYTEAAAKRAAEAAAITNFFATNLFVLYPNHPFTLSGDMNEDNTNTLAIQRLISAPTTLRLTNPTNPFSGSGDTYDSRTPNSRIDYIFPCTQLASNIMAAQVFRTDLLSPTPTNLLKYDSTNASDHLPVLMTFANPFNTPFKVVSITRSNSGVALKWESATNRFYSVQASTNLTQWTVLASNLFATGTNFTFTTNSLTEREKFFRIHRVP